MVNVSFTSFYDEIFLLVLLQWHIGKSSKKSSFVSVTNQVTIKLTSYIFITIYLPKLKLEPSSIHSTFKIQPVTKMQVTQTPKPVDFLKPYLSHTLENSNLTLSG